MDQKRGNTRQGASRTSVAVSSLQECHECFATSSTLTYSRDMLLVCRPMLLTWHANTAARSA